MEFASGANAGAKGIKFACTEVDEQSEGLFPDVGGEGIQVLGVGCSLVHWQVLQSMSKRGERLMQFHKSRCATE